MSVRDTHWDVLEGAEGHGGVFGCGHDVHLFFFKKMTCSEHYCYGCYYLLSEFNVATKDYLPVLLVSIQRVTYICYLPWFKQLLTFVTSHYSNSYLPLLLVFIQIITYLC